MSNSKSFKISIIGIGIALNVAGAFMAFILRLPIYIDSLGTIMTGFLLGPICGIITGILGSITSGITFDIYSLYFAPVQIVTGFLFGILFKSGMFKGKKIFIGVFISTILVSFISAMITVFVFDGFTSSGSSYIVIILKNLGVNPIISAFIIQFITDYCDKLFAAILIVKVVSLIPRSIKEKLYIKNFVKYI